MTSADGLILDRLTSVLEQRKQERPRDSYTAHLFASGLDEILRKVSEEAEETVVAARSGDAERLVYEAADLWFHSLVMLVHQGLSHKDVLRELARRFGTPGFEEKRRRGNVRGDG